MQVALVKDSNRISLNRTLADSALASRVRTRVSQLSADLVRVFSNLSSSPSVAVVPLRSLARQTHQQILQVRVVALELDKALALARLTQVQVVICRSPFQ